MEVSKGGQEKLRSDFQSTRRGAVRVGEMGRGNDPMGQGRSAWRDEILILSGKSWGWRIEDRLACEIRHTLSSDIILYIHLNCLSKLLSISLKWCCKAHSTPSRFTHTSTYMYMTEVLRWLPITSHIQYTPPGLHTTTLPWTKYLSDFMLKPISSSSATPCSSSECPPLVSRISTTSSRSLMRRFFFLRGRRWGYRGFPQSLKATMRQYTLKN